MKIHGKKYSRNELRKSFAYHGVRFNPEPDHTPIGDYKGRLIYSSNIPGAFMYAVLHRAPGEKGPKRPKRRELNRAILAAKKLRQENRRSR